MLQKPVNKIWVTIVVERGVITSVETFRDQISAETRKQLHLAIIITMDDDVVIYEVPIQETLSPQY